jgi:SAM-dependent methyltransferase
MRYYLLYIRRMKVNNRFRNENPGLALPPPYLVYESFDLDYKKYYTDSRETASWLVDFFRKYKELKNASLLDWGCGPARIIRHMPALLDASCKIYGTDYNAQSITWNRANIPGIEFSLNGAHPPLSYPDNSFDIIYGISIFTHLPEDLHYSWFNELVRVSKPGAILFLTLHGNAFRTKLTQAEEEVFDAGKLLIKGNTKVGHRTYAAFHPEPFVKQWTFAHTVLEHIPGEVIHEKPQQDIWILRISK